MDDSERAELMIKATAAMAAGGAALADPAAGIVAAGLVPLLDAAIGRWQQRQARNVLLALDTASSSSHLDGEDILNRLCEDPARLALLGDALQAAAHSAYDDRIRALGRALATGALAEDGAVVEEERLWVGLMANIEAPHLRILLYLSQPPPTGALVDTFAQQSELAEIAGTSYEMTGHLLATLNQNNLVRSRLGSSFPRGAEQHRGAWASETFWQADRLASPLLERFRNVGTVPASA